MRQLDLAEDEVDDGVEKFVLVRYVVVDRHRFDAELVRERADGQSWDAAGVGDRDGGEDPLPAEGTALRTTDLLLH
jgi:hypothetical protein